ncbi:MAG: beta-galactosidase, partial [Candidatus Microbacterium stercoravium]
PKRPGELIRDSLTHVAHGADAVCYFQWRQSVAGAEKFHSAMVPHGGEDTRVFRDVVKLGGILQDLGDVVGSDRARADVAIVFDWESWRASELDSHPTEKLRYRREAFDWWTALTNAGMRVDVVPADTPLDGYRLAIAPVLYSVPTALRESLERYVEGGGHLVTTYFSGIVDENDHIWLGGYPGAFRDLLGVRVEEFRPLWEGEQVALSNGTTGTLWSEPVDVTAPDVEVLVRYEGEEELDAAVTRRPVGSGSAAYVSTRLGVEGIGALLPTLLDGAGVASDLPEAIRGSVELVVREGANGRFEFLINRTDDEVDLGEGDYLCGSAILPARGVAVRRA